MFFGRLLLTTCLIAISAPMSALEFEPNAEVRSRHAFFRHIDSFVDSFFNQDYVVASKKKKKKKKDEDKKPGTTTSLSGTISSTNKESGNQSKQGKVKSSKSDTNDSSSIHKSELSSHQSQSQGVTPIQPLAKISGGSSSDQTISASQQEAQKNANLDYTKNAQRNTPPAAVEAEAAASANGKAAQQTSGDSYISASSDRASVYSPSYSNNYYDFERTPRYEPTPPKSYYDSMMEKFQDLFSGNEPKPNVVEPKPNVVENKPKIKNNFDDFFEKLEKEFSNKIRLSENKDNLSVNLEEIEREITTYRQHRNKSKPNVVHLKTSDSLNDIIKEVDDLLNPVNDEKQLFEDIDTLVGIKLCQTLIERNNKQLQNLEERAKQIKEENEKAQQNINKQIEQIETRNEQINKETKALDNTKEAVDETKKFLFGNAASSHSDNAVVEKWVNESPIAEEDKNNISILSEAPDAPIDSIDISQLSEAPDAPIDNVDISQLSEAPDAPIDNVDISQLSEAPLPPEETQSTSIGKDEPLIDFLEKMADVWNKTMGDSPVNIDNIDQAIKTLNQDNNDPFGWGGMTAQRWDRDEVGLSKHEKTPDNQEEKLGQEFGIFGLGQFAEDGPFANYGNGAIAALVQLLGGSDFTISSGNNEKNLPALFGHEPSKDGTPENLYNIDMEATLNGGKQEVDSISQKVELNKKSETTLSEEQMAQLIGSNVEESGREHPDNVINPGSAIPISEGHAKALWWRIPATAAPTPESPMEALWRTMSHRRQHIEPDSQNNSFIESGSNSFIENNQPAVSLPTDSLAKKLEVVVAKPESPKPTSYNALQSRREATTSVPLVDQLRKRSNSLKQTQTNVRKTNSTPIALEKTFENIWSKKTVEDDTKHINPHMPERDDSEWDD